MDIVHINPEERIPMPGGTLRGTPPRDFSRDPHLWPDTVAPTHAQARVVLAIARSLQRHIDERGWSLREVSVLTGVNRQVIANLLAGRSWVDVVTVSLLEDGLDAVLWPGAGTRASVAALGPGM
ncbi:helix-turn-helix domain-containing protein [Kitasatospora sp. NPDC052868]|uniref:helix-turn-helix domain-containing protein n=1 Tax=Kitasatospora sp. NPDC052868 TaxID=3364060 RepID=UPI0037CAF486